MSADNLGMRLLNECVEVKLDDVDLLRLSQTLSEQDARRDETISQLDRLLSVNYAQTQGRQLRLPVLEICAEDTGAGRSQLVYYIIAKAILPDCDGSRDLDGKNNAVVLFDNDAHFDVNRLVQVMHSHIEAKLSTEDRLTDVHELIERSLQHVHIFQPRNMTLLIEALNGLKDYLYDSSAHLSSGRAVHSIIIDSASAFYWETRAVLENEQVAALDAKAPGAPTTIMPPPKPNPYMLLVNRLRSLQQTLNCAVIATTTASLYKNAASGERSLRTLPTPWPSFPTNKLMLKREQVRMFAVGTPWEDAAKDGQLRQSAVELGRFSVKSIGGGERFNFTVTKDGVRVLDGMQKEDDDQ